MKNTFLLALIVALCLPLSLVAKPRKKKVPAGSVAQMIAGHQWEGVNDYLFHEGTAVVEGRLVGFSGKMPTGIVFNIKDMVLKKDDNQLLEVSADGDVKGTLRLPHSQFCFVEGINLNMYVGVGDTLRFVYDASQADNHRLTFTGASTTADVNRHWPLLEKQFYGNNPLPHTADFSTISALHDFLDICERTADSCMNVIARHELPLGNVTPLARDILHYGLINEAFKRVLDALMYYSNNGYDYVKDPKKDYPELVQKPGYVPCDELRKFRLFVRYDKMMMNTPLVLSSPQSWVVPNRLLYNHYRLDFKRWRNSAPYPQTAEDSLLIVEQWKAFHTLPRLYRPEVAQYISQATGRPCYSRSDYWREQITRHRAETGLGDSFMQQMKLCHELGMDMLCNELGDAPDVVASYVAETLPFITHPVLTHHVLEAYRQWVVKHETCTDVPKAGIITDPTLLSLLAPYKGRLLFVDFWNMGCGPCRSSMLAQRDMVARISRSGIPASVLYVSDDEGSRRTSAEEWLAKNNINGEHIFVTNDQWMKLRSVLNFSAIPFCIIVNTDGTMHGSGTSANSYEFDALLKEQFPAYKSIK